MLVLSPVTRCFKSSDDIGIFIELQSTLPRVTIHFWESSKHTLYITSYPWQYKLTNSSWSFCIRAESLVPYATICFLHCCQTQRYVLFHFQQLKLNCPAKYICKVQPSPTHYQPPILWSLIHNIFLLSVVLRIAQHCLHLYFMDPIFKSIISCLL